MTLECQSQESGLNKVLRHRHLQIRPNLGSCPSNSYCFGFGFSPNSSDSVIAKGCRILKICLLYYQWFEHFQSFIRIEAVQGASKAEFPLLELSEYLSLCLKFALRIMGCSFGI